MNRMLWKGDRVRVRHKSTSCDVKVGETGTVLEVEDHLYDCIVKFVQDGRNSFHECDRNLLAKMNDQSPNEEHLPFLEENPKMTESKSVKDYFESDHRYAIEEKEIHDLYVSCFQQEWQRLRTDPRHAKLSDVDIVEMCKGTSNMLVAFLDNVFNYEVVLSKARSQKGGDEA